MENKIGSFNFSDYKIEIVTIDFKHITLRIISKENSKLNGIEITMNKKEYIGFTDELDECITAIENEDLHY